MTVTVGIDVIKGEGHRVVLSVVVDTIVIDLVNRHSLLHKTHLIDHQNSILAAFRCEMQFRLTWRTFVGINLQLDCSGSSSSKT